MKYLVEQKAYLTSKGNRMSEVEIFFHGLDQKAIEAVWPVITQTRSVSNTGDWLAVEYEYAERLGERPELSEQRVQESLERVIDLIKTSPDTKIKAVRVAKSAQGKE